MFIKEKIKRKKKHFNKILLIRQKKCFLLLKILIFLHIKKAFSKKKTLCYSNVFDQIQSTDTGS